MSKQTQAYNDVMDGVGPSLPNDIEYMNAYRLYKSVRGENHSDAMEHHNFD